MKRKSQKKGISLIALIITIIVIVLLAAIVVNTAITTPQSANFAKFASDMGELQQAVTLTYFDIYSVEAVKSSPKTDAEIYEIIAKGDGESILAIDVPSTLGTKVAWKVNNATKINSVDTLPTSYGDLYLTNNGTIYLAEGFPYQGATYLTASIKLNGSVSTSSNTIENSLGENLKNYTIYGNSIQNGTPTPSSPVAIQSLGDNGSIEVNVEGKNLFSNNINDYTVLGTYKYIAFPHNNYTITISDNNTSISTSDMYIGYYGNANSVGSFTVNWLVYNGEIRYTSRYNLYGIVIIASNQEELNNIMKRFNVQIELGSTATAYEPYQEQRYTINLGGHEPLRAIGDVADTLDYTTGKIIRRIGKIAFDGVTDGEKVSDKNKDNGDYKSFYIALSILKVKDGIMLCSHFPNISWNTIPSGNYWWSAAESTGMRINSSYLTNYSDSLTDAEKVAIANKWIAAQKTLGNPLTVYALLDTPHEEEGTITMPLISTVEGQNTITASDETVSASKIDVTCYQN